jgi:hypothetical protein
VGFRTQTTENNCYINIWVFRWMTNQMRKELGFLGNTRAAKQILKGTYKVSMENQRYTQELLNEMKKVNLTYPPPEAILETNDYIEGWKKVKEKTSSGISGIHFDHMKVSMYRFK